VNESEVFVVASRKSRGQRDIFSRESGLSWKIEFQSRAEVEVELDFKEN
jgi:hypothetical protein